MKLLNIFTFEKTVLLTTALILSICANVGYTVLNSKAEPAIERYHEYKDDMFKDLVIHALYDKDGLKTLTNEDIDTLLKDYNTFNEQSDELSKSLETLSSFRYILDTLFGASAILLIIASFPSSKKETDQEVIQS